MIDPRGLSVMDWTDSMSFLLDSESPIMRLDNPDNWRIWARNFIGDPDLVGQNMPDPDYFEDWEEWAMRLNSTVDLIG